MKDLLGGEQMRPLGTLRVVRAAPGNREHGAGPGGHLAMALSGRVFTLLTTAAPEGLGAEESVSRNGNSCSVAEKGLFGPHHGGFLAEDQKYFLELRSTLFVRRGQG